MNKQLSVQQRWIVFLPALMMLLFSQVNFYMSQGERRDEAAERAMKRWLKEDRAIGEKLAKRLPEETRRQIYVEYYNAMAEEFDVGIRRTDIPSDGGETLYQIYEAPVAKKYGITRQEMEAIGTEGDMHRWPHPWYRPFPLGLFR